MPEAQLSSPVTVVIYARKSTKDGGRSEASQVESCTDEAEAREWVVRKVFRDNVGASRHSRGDRPDYTALTAYVTEQTPDVLMIWEVSRADRKLRTWIDMVDLCKLTGTQLFIVKDDRLYNPRKASDRKNLLQDGLDAEYESDKTSERTKREMAKNAKAGRPHGRLLYGYSRTYELGKLVGQTAHPEQAPIVKEAFTRLAEGEGCITITRDFNSRGIASSQGTSWSEKSLSRMLRNPAYIAKRVHQGEIVGDADWPALIDEDTFYACKRILEDPTRRTQFDSKVKYLLSGIASCGVCHNVLRVRKQSKRNFYSYTCVTNWCTAIKVDLLDEYVISEVKSRLVYLDSKNLDDPDQEARRAEAKAEAEDLRAYLIQFTKDAVSQRLSAAHVAQVVQEVQSQINTAEARAQATTGPITKLVRILVTDPARFDASTTEIQRESIRNLTDAIVVQPVGRGFAVYDVSSRVDIEWTEDRLALDPHS